MKTRPASAPALTSRFPVGCLDGDLPCAERIEGSSGRNEQLKHGRRAVSWFVYRIPGRHSGQRPFRAG